MRRGTIVGMYKTMCEEDQRTFKRWLKANTLVGAIIAAVLVAMASRGSIAPETRQAATKSIESVGEALRGM